MRYVVNRISFTYMSFNNKYYYIRINFKFQ